MEFKQKFNPKGHLILAEKLLKDCNTESEYRTIINRAYYSCYTYLNYRFKPFAKYKDIYSEHQLCINFLKNHVNPILVKIGELLATLFLQRKDADYELNYVFIKKNAEDAVDSANSIFELIEEIEDDLIYINK